MREKGERRIFYVFPENLAQYFKGCRVRGFNFRGMKTQAAIGILKWTNKVGFSC
jgi:hypothetical protein